MKDHGLCMGVCVCEITDSWVASLQVEPGDNPELEHFDLPPAWFANWISCCFTLLLPALDPGMPRRKVGYR